MAESGAADIPGPTGVQCRQAPGHTHLPDAAACSVRVEPGQLLTDGGEREGVLGRIGFQLDTPPGLGDDVHNHRDGDHDQGQEWGVHRKYDVRQEPQRERQHEQQRKQPKHRPLAASVNASARRPGRIRLPGGRLSRHAARALAWAARIGEPLPLAHALWRVALRAASVVPTLCQLLLPRDVARRPRGPPEETPWAPAPHCRRPEHANRGPCMGDSVTSAKGTEQLARQAREPRSIKKGSTQDRIRTCASEEIRALI